MSHEIELVGGSGDVPAMRSSAMVERSSVLLMPVMDVNTAMTRLKEFQEFCANYLQESKDGGTDGGDYGVIPGTKKKTLLKSGADKLKEIYGLYDEYVVVSSVEDWERGLFDYTLKCILRSRRDDSMVGTGVGSCSSFESKYRWRDAKRACPQCGKATIIKGAAQYGGGYVCWKKDGRSDGCGAKFADNDKTITDQVQGRIENPDIIDSKNTVLKMAKKRANIDAVIGVTRSSGTFTQDMEDFPLPPKPPEAAVTTQAMPVPPPPRKAAAPIQEPVPAAKDKGPSPGPQAAEDADMERPFDPDEHIDLPRQRALHRAFRDATTITATAADAFLREWLKKEGYVDAEGKGTTKTIPLGLFGEVKEAALRFAATLK